MTRTKYVAEFAYHGMPVGLFLGSTPPHAEGVFEYQPYRGPGHLEMWQEIERNGFAKCAYELNGAALSFEVRDVGEYAKLALSVFVP